MQEETGADVFGRSTCITWLQKGHLWYSNIVGMPSMALDFAVPNDIL